MPNLLPEKNKRKVTTEYVFRLGVAFSVALLLTEVMFLLLLWPSYIASKNNVTEAMDDVAIFKQSVDFRESDTLEKLLKRENSKIDLLSEKQVVPMGDVIEKVVSYKPKGVRINGLFYKSGEDETGTVEFIIRGVADNRDVLISFVESLEKEDSFFEIDFPVSSLTKGEEIDFSASIKVKTSN